MKQGRHRSGAEPSPLDESVIEAHDRGWEALADEHAALPTQDAPWALAAVGAFAGQPVLLQRERDGALDAVAPLTRRAGRLELLGAHELSEPGDLLARSEDALGALAEELVATGMPLVLHRISPASATIPALRQALGTRGLLQRRSAPGHPVIELDERWSEPGGGLSSSRRSSLRRARRRAERSGEIAVELLAPSPDGLDPLLDVAFAVEARSWKGAAGTALAQSPAIARFVRRYAHETARRGTLRLQFLRIDGEAVAMQIAVEWRRRLWLLKIGYDEAHANASPGQLLLAESIADAARRGLDGYQLLGTPAPWTEVWTSDVTPCLTLYSYPANPRGAIAAGGDAGRVLRRLAGRQASTLKSTALRTAAAHYVAGPQLADAVREEAVYAAAGYATVVGYWDGPDARASEVVAEYRAAAAAVPAGAQLSIKVGATVTDGPPLDELLATCRERGVGLHFDSLGPENADATLAAAVRLGAQAPGEVGCTLAGRWTRSVADAELAIGHGMRVRVVKSEWADPADPDRDPVAGCLEVVDALAGGARHVAVATHDAALAAQALERLIAAGTPCELQVLHRMPARAAIGAARRLGCEVRVYIPYGAGRIPYAIGDARRKPAVLARALGDLLPNRVHAWSQVPR